MRRLTVVLRSLTQNVQTQEIHTLLVRRVLLPRVAVGTRLYCCFPTDFYGSLTVAVVVRVIVAGRSSSSTCRMPSLHLSDPYL
jgi:hypothetical protein